MSENEDLKKRIALRNVRIITALRNAGIGPDLVTGAAIFEIGVELLAVGGVDRDALDDLEMARVDLPNGETLKPAPGKVLYLATMNGRPTHIRSAGREHPGARTRPRRGRVNPAGAP
jgi:hypothetical protein